MRAVERHCPFATVIQSREPSISSGLILGASSFIAPGLIFIHPSNAFLAFSMFPKTFFNPSCAVLALHCRFALACFHAFLWSSISLFSATNVPSNFSFKSSLRRAPRKSQIWSARTSILNVSPDFLKVALTVIVSSVAVPFNCPCGTFSQKSSSRTFSSARARDTMCLSHVGREGYAWKPPQTQGPISA